MLKRTEGIVLKSSPFGEADLIVTYLTRDFGILKTFAKSPRKIKSRFGSSLEPFTCSRISFWGKEEAALPRLTQSDIIHSFYSVRDKMKCFIKVYEIVELILNFMPEREANRKVYELLMHALHAAEADCSAEILPVYYKLNVLEIAGFLPKLHGCGRCGRKGNNFYLSHGAVLCEECSREYGASMRISAGAVSLYMSLREWRPSQIKRIKPQESVIKELTILLDEHIRYITERNLKTKTFAMSLKI